MVEADVDGEVGQLAIGLAEHAVLVVAEGRGAEPERPVLLIGMPRRGQRLDDALRQARRAHVGGLVGPAVELDAVVSEHLTLARHHVPHGMAPGLFDPLGLGPGQEARRPPVPLEVVCREVDEVLARVGPLRQLDRLAQGLLQAHHE